MHVLQYLKYCNTLGSLTSLLAEFQTTALWYRFLTEPKAEGTNRNQKTTSLWQHQGRLMYGTPNISRPATAGTNSLRLLYMFLLERPSFAPRESRQLLASGTSTLFVGSFHEIYNCMNHGSAVARVTKDRAARLHLPSTVGNQLGMKRHPSYR